MSLSPGSVRRVTGLTRLVLPSPNGSTISASLADVGATVVIGCLRNAAAVAAHLTNGAAEAAVVLVAAGERWHDGFAGEADASDLAPVLRAGVLGSAGASGAT